MKVRVLIKCFVENSLREEGEVFEYNGQVNDCLEPIDGSWESENDEATVAVMEAPKRKPGRPKMTKDTDGA
jgi:hypothetical protein